MKNSIVAAVGFTIILGLVPAHAASRATVTSSPWKFQRSVNKMTDEVQCRLDFPTKNILLSFQGPKIYVVANHYLGLEDDSNLLFIRVDHNPALSLGVRVVTGQLGAIEDKAAISDLVEQLRSGNAIRVQILPPGGVSMEEDFAHITGFATAYRRFETCIEHASH